MNESQGKADRLNVNNIPDGGNQSDTGPVAGGATHGRASVEPSSADSGGTSVSSAPHGTFEVAAVAPQLGGVRNAESTLEQVGHAQSGPGAEEEAAENAD